MAKPLTKRQKIEISVAAVAVFAYLFALPAYLGSVCSVTHQAHKPASYQFSINGEQQSHAAEQANKKTVTPSFVSSIKATGSANPTEEAAEPPETWWQRFRCEVNASDWFIGLFTLFLAIATYFLWRETERLAGGADDQADKMERSIGEAARAAAAMEDVALAMSQNATNAGTVITNQRDFAQRQLRAYVSVTIGSAVFQERPKGLRFEGRPRIVNDGMTPAYKVRHAIKAAIVPFPIPADFVFDIPEKEFRGGTSIGPRQDREVGAVTDNFVPDQDVAGIKGLSAKQCLFVWGRVTYEDAFGSPHYADCAQILTWRKDDSVFGVFEPRHNDSD